MTYMKNINFKRFFGIYRCWDPCITHNCGSFINNIRSVFNLRLFSSAPINRFYSCPIHKQFKDIPSSFVPGKDLPLHVYFNMSDLSSSVFKNRIIDKVSLNFVYTVFVKVRYNHDSLFMAGNQFGF